MPSSLRLSRFAPYRLRMNQQVYLAIVAALLVAFLLTFAFYRYVAQPSTRNTAAYATLVKFVSDALPPLGAPEAAQAAVVEDWVARTRAAIALYDPNRKLIVAAGHRHLHPPPAGQTTDGWMPGESNIYAAVLPDGRWVLVAIEGRSGPLTLGFALFLITLTVALGVYPVVGKLTRRLEKLQQSVAEFGAGNLSVRADTAGADEVGMLARSFNHSAGQLEALVKAQKSLLANASHELRSPLARLQMAVGLLGTDGKRAVTEEINRNIRELDELIDEILLASRLDSPQAMQGLRLESVNLSRLLREECSRYGATFSGDEGQIVGHRALLQRMVRNLLENARRYGAGAPIEVRATRVDGAQMEFSVWDRGAGVPPEEMERIFEPFYRAPGAKESAGGVGLGLSLVRSIAAQHRGTARCVARPGGGSGFVVRLPLE